MLESDTGALTHDELWYSNRYKHQQFIVHVKESFRPRTNIWLCQLCSLYWC